MIVTLILLRVINEKDLFKRLLGVRSDAAGNQQRLRPIND